ncbi:PP2C family protein-serine/threonine phosphatase [Streptomyces sp. NPDC051322]|uniref:PP2C family protein-serine/threonine phosphatase n=1 Tax=Streptomyces sp. NPDC051322 TaxID=3154645 RepID=UPI00344E6D5A
MAALLVVAVLLAVDELGGSRVRIAGLLVAVPALSAVFLGAVPVLVVAVAAIGAAVAAGGNNAQLGHENFTIVLITMVLISGASVMAAAARTRRERELAQARWVAAVTQRALMPPLPESLGSLTLASMYLAADDEAAIGGDLYAVARLDGGDTRLIVGDVQGKGLGATELAGFLIGAFRRAARNRVPLRELPANVDRAIREDIADLAMSSPKPSRSPSGTSALPPGPPPPAPPGSPGPESFITAVVVDVQDSGRTLRFVSCGHPPPLLLRDDGVRTLTSDVPALPLGLGDLGQDPQEPGTCPLARGDILLLYTDGVIETRDAEGAFYPLAERLAGLRGRSPAQLLRAVREDLEHYAASRLSDDVAMVAVQWPGDADPERQID